MANGTIVTPKARLALGKSSNCKRLVTTCEQHVASIMATSQYASDPELKSSTDVVAQDAAELSGIMTELQKLRDQVSSLETKRDVVAARLRTNHGHMESNVTRAAGGDAAVIEKMGGRVAKRTVLPATDEPPQNLALRATSTAGEAEATCKADRRAASYLYQHGSDPTNPDAWPAPEVVSGARHVFRGLTVGKQEFFRVAVVRRGCGQSKWSSIVAMTVR